MIGMVIQIQNEIVQFALYDEPTTIEVIKPENMDVKIGESYKLKKKNDEYEIIRKEVKQNANSKRSN